MSQQASRPPPSSLSRLKAMTAAMIDSDLRDLKTMQVFYFLLQHLNTQEPYVRILSVKYTITAALLQDRLSLLIIARLHLEVDHRLPV